ncbi:MAG: M48 family metallopeptidase [Acidimicrobiales bacterium]
MAATSPRWLTWGQRRVAYTLTREHRGDLKITVFPDLRVVVWAPAAQPLAHIERRISARRAWIARRLHEFEQMPVSTAPRRYVAGESHWFFGRQYRLVLSSGPTRVSRSAGRLLVSVPRPNSPISVRRAVEAWYVIEARKAYRDLVTHVRVRSRRLVTLTISVRVRRMRRRWGSCSSTGVITLNPLLVQAPRGCIEYVVAHELSHLLVPDHSARFTRVLSQLMPDWERQRARLNRHEVAR